MTPLWSFRGRLRGVDVAWMILLLDSYFSLVSRVPRVLDPRRWLRHLVPSSSSSRFPLSWFLQEITSSLTYFLSFFYLQACSRYAMRSARSWGFFRPANTIFVPGMYFFGFSKYVKSVSLFQVMPEFWKFHYKNVIDDGNMRFGRFCKNLSKISKNYSPFALFASV